LNKSSFISLNAIVNKIVSVLFRLDYSCYSQFFINKIQSF